MTTSEIQTRWHEIYTHLKSRCTCTHHEAEDLTQELFTRLLRRGILDHLADRFDSEDDIRNYLFAAARNQFKEQLRKQNTCKRGGRVAHVSIGDETDRTDPPSTNSDPSAVVERREIFRNWRRDLALLSSEVARCGKRLLFSRLEDALSPGGGPVDTRAAADALGVTHVSVRVQLHRWKTHLIGRMRERFEPAGAA